MCVQVVEADCLLWGKKERTWGTDNSFCLSEELAIGAGR